MDETTKTLILKLKDLDSLALSIYQHCLDNGGENNIVFSLYDVFRIIESNIILLLDKNTLKKFLPIFHYTIKYSENNDETLEDSAKFFNFLTEKYLNEENVQELIFELLYQFLFSISSWNAINKFESNFNIINVYSESKTIRLRSRLCLELLINVFPKIDMLRIIKFKNDAYFAESFSHFISVLLADKIYMKSEFWLTCLCNLLNENQKFAIYWLKEALQDIERFEFKEFEVTNFFKWNPKKSKEICKSWHLYLATLESLDGKQSHLILPSLEQLKNNKIYGIWNQFIACEIMKHTNTIVLRWAANFIINSFACNDFDILDKYLEGTQQSLVVIIEGFNNTFLYSGADSLEAQNFESFICGDPEKFFKIFVTINWKSIPLYVLIQFLDKISLEQKNENFIEHLFNLASKIRRIENKLIRQKLRIKFFTIFENNLSKIEIQLYFQLLELLYNENEKKSESELKLIGSKIKGKGSVDLLVHKCPLEVMLKNSSLIENDSVSAQLLKDVSQVLKDDEDVKFFQIYFKIYAINMENHDYILNEALEIIKNDFKGIGKNKINTEINFSIIKQRFVDQVATKIFEFYENKLVNLISTNENYDIEILLKDKCIEQNIDLELFFSKGSFEILNQLLGKKYLSKIFLCNDFETRQRSLNKNLLNRMSLEISIHSKICGFNTVKNTIEGLIFFISPEFPEVLNYILDIDPINCDTFNIVFSACLENCKCINPSLKDFYSSENGLNFLIRGLLYGEPLLGEPRIEYEYLIKSKLTHFMVTPAKVRQFAAKLLCYLVRNIFDESIILKLTDKLLTERENLNNKKSRYFKNSKHHRLQLRLTQALAVISANSNLSKETEWTDRYLKLLLEENNQTDITYIMELLVAKTIPISKLIELLEDATNLNNSGIISLFAISFLVAYNNLTINDLELIKRIIKLLMPWTMGQNFHIRLYSQIPIYHLIKHFELKDYFIVSESIFESMKQGTSEKNYKKLNHDFRFKKPNLKNLLQFDVLYYAIPHLNNTDIDEWFNENLENKCFDLFKEFYEEPQTVSCKDVITIDVENIQRKINPINFEEQNFCLFSEGSKENNTKEINMIVIASLVDKLPNLGGIARTCEVFGIKNLAISSLKYSQTKEFKGLSMTAEKWLNLIELKPDNIQNYLVQYKLLGYKIIGAEQTSNSENFKNFKFPKKTILLLGHEKEGIPANLIAYLDHAVEIPQFGKVRSLNVHVTGALFMWEFCKQHISEL